MRDGAAACVALRLSGQVIGRQGMALALVQRTDRFRNALLGLPLRRARDAISRTHPATGLAQAKEDPRTWHSCSIPSGRKVRISWTAEHILRPLSEYLKRRQRLL